MAADYNSAKNLAGSLEVRHGELWKLYF